MGNKLKKNVKFDYAAFSPDGKSFEKISLEKIIELKLSDNMLFNKTYPNHLYCPECYKPQLVLVENKVKRYFLRGYPNQQHANDCYKGFDLVSQKVFDTFLINSESTNFINKKLQKVIDKMLRNVKSNKDTFLIKVINKECLTEVIQEKEINKKSRIIKQIPHKSITSPFDDDDFDVFKLFYGNVDIVLLEKENKKNNEKFYVLEFFKKNSKYKFCSLSMGTKIYYFFVKKYNLNVGETIKNVYVSFVSKLKQNGKYKNGKLIHSDYCIIEIV